jgi:hypothetical protein
MNWKLIIALSSYGLVMGIGLGLGFIPENRILFRIGIPFALAVWIGAKIDRKLFLHGFLVGFIGESFKWSTVFILFPAYMDHHFSGSLEEARYFWLLMIFYGINIAVWVGCLAWLAADLKPYLRSIRGQISEKKTVPPTKFFIYIIASLFSFFGSFSCFFMLLSSCSGHGPIIPKISMWILPISAIAAWIFYRLGKLFLKLSISSQLSDK